MKLREEEFYYQYQQHGGTTIIPTEIFNELYDDATEEIQRLNNIINGLEEYIEEIKDRVIMYGIDDDTYKTTNLYRDIKNKIKELKGSE